jgi:thiamine biosynthesis lipoprotein
MGSLLEITAYGGADRCRPALEAAYAEVKRLEAVLSPFRAESELSRVNREAPYRPVSADPELIDVLTLSLGFTRQTGGAVDVTVGPLMRLWKHRFSETEDIPPSPEQVERTLRLVGYQHVIVDSDRSTVSYQHPGMSIEFGAIGKGYAVDRAVNVLKHHGVGAALVSFGSSLYALGSPPDRDGWRIAIRQPEDRGRVVDTITLRDGALGTSGNDQQAMRLAGRWYGHIMDPRTGYPSEGLSGASVLAPTAVEADALSTAVFVLGRDDGLRFLERHGGVEGLVVSEERTQGFSITSTAGWRCRRVRIPPVREISRRRFLGGVLGGVSWLLLAPSRGHAIVYLTAEEALRRLIPEAKTFREVAIRLSPLQKERVAGLLGSVVREDAYRSWIVEHAGRAMAHAVLLNVIGKEQPITFLVVVGANGVVRGVEVLIYRESEGSEIRSGRFIRQFVGKTLAAPLKLGRDIEAISGATLSSRSTAYAVKKALALIEVVYRTTDGDTR